MHHHRCDLSFGNLLELRYQLVTVGVFVVPSSPDLHSDGTSEMLCERVDRFV